VIILQKSNIYDQGLLNTHVHEAYLYSSEEEYLLSFMDKYASTCGQEVDDDIILLAQEKALNHKGNTMKWYSKAILKEDLIIEVGEEIDIIDKNNNKKSSQIISITDDGLYLKNIDAEKNEDNILFGYLTDEGNFVYEPIQPRLASEIHINSHYIIPQFEEKDLGFKEAVKSSNIDTVKKRALYILGSLDRLFPTTKWSVRIIDSTGENLEVLE